MERRNDKELVAAAAAGDQLAFELLVEKHFKAVYLIAYSRLGQPEPAEDLAQEVFLRAYLHLGQLADGSRFANWVSRVARNLSEDWRRRRQTASRLLPLVPIEREIAEVVQSSNENVRDKLEREERETAVRKAVLALAPDRREIILLLYGEGLSEREIARRLGLNHTTVHYHHQRALEQFRGEIGNWLKQDITLVWPRAHAPRKAAALIAATALLSTETKLSLAATSAATMPKVVGAGSAAASAGKGAAVAASQTTIASATELAVITGVGIMKGKLGIMLGALAGLAATGGLYYSAAKPGGWVKPEVTISRSNSTGGRTMYGSPLLGKFGFKGGTLQAMLSDCAGTSPARLVLRPGLPNDKYDVDVTGICLSPEDSVLPILRREIPRQTGYGYTIEKRTTNVLVLRAPAGRSESLRDPGKSARNWLIPGKLKAERASMDDLAQALEAALGIPVINETGLAGEYSFELRWHPRKPQKIPGWLHKQLGLQIIPEKREIDFVVAGKVLAGA